jgi:hypothetical protein
MEIQVNATHLAKGALINGVLNALINGSINFFQVKDKSELFLTIDSISNGSHSVLGGAVVLATTLAIILTSIGYFTVRSAQKPPYFPKAFLLTIKNAFFTFGILATASILVQRLAGSIAVSPFTSAIVVGIIAGLVASIIDFLTKKELLNV